MLDCMPTPTDFWEQKLQEGRSWHYWPNESLVRLISTRYASGQGFQAMELGYGAGNNLWFLHEHGFRVIGLDCTHAAMQQAIQFLQSKRIGIAMGMLHVQPMQRLEDVVGDESVDVIVECLALQHVNWDEHSTVMQRVHHALKPGGRFYSVHLTDETQDVTVSPEISRFCYDVTSPKAAYPYNGLVCMPPLAEYLQLAERYFKVERYWATTIHQAAHERRDIVGEWYTGWQVGTVVLEGQKR